MSRNGKNNKGGRPFGSKTKATLEKEIVQKNLAQRYMRTADKLANAQIGLATGSTYIYKLKKGSNKPELVTSQTEIEHYLEQRIENDTEEFKDGTTYYFITAKDPENSAIESIWNRSVGKVKDEVDHSVNVVFSLIALAKQAEEREKLGNVEIIRLEKPI